MMFTEKPAVELLNSTASVDAIKMRTVLRKPAVLAATGWSNSTLYEKINKGLFPKPVKLDPDGRTVVWFEDEVAEFQKRAVARHAVAA
jgi:prophage regulatory protein